MASSDVDAKPTETARSGVQLPHDDGKPLDACSKSNGKNMPILFADLGLSKETMRGLRDGKFDRMSDIQRESIPVILSGRDMLGASKTGSGKTLAFLVPLLEILRRGNCQRLDGLWALVISPTRELAAQIFDVLRVVGKHHAFSAGLVIGGRDRGNEKELKREQKLVANRNILVATPGRLQQHLEQAPLFQVSDLKLLVLDEADRLLDLGFEASLNAILEYLPRTRQTLLFSATQTRQVKALARLSLRAAVFVSIFDVSSSVTPEKLAQSYTICNLPRKLTILWSFIKSHSRKKVLIFLASCNQVRFVFEVFRRLRPGNPLMALHGHLKQEKRMDVFYSFCKKKSACLFATDVAARGLDFPVVDWVVQLDCPEDPETYIHRVGRTARFSAGGKSLLVLAPSERKMIDLLLEKSVAVNETYVNPDKAFSIEKQCAAFCAQDADVKRLAEKAFSSYVKSIHLMKNREVFDLSRLPLQDFSRSLGLVGSPVVDFVSAKKGNLALGKEKRRLKAVAGRQKKSADGSIDAEELLVNPKKEREVEDLRPEELCEMNRLERVKQGPQRLVFDEGMSSDADSSESSDSGEEEQRIDEFEEVAGSKRKRDEPARTSLPRGDALMETLDVEEQRVMGLLKRRRVE